MPSNEPLLIPGSGDPVSVYRRRIEQILAGHAQPAQVQGLLDRYEAAVLKAQEDPQLAESVHDEDYGRIITELCRRRHELGWTQHTLASRMAISQALVSKIERRERVLRQHRHAQWLRVLAEGEKEREL